MAEYLIKDTTLRDLADEIRKETGKTDQLLGSLMTDELRTFSDSLTEEIALQNTALDDLEAELNNLEEGSGGSDSNKLALVVGTQSADTSYNITATDLEGVTGIKEYAFYQCSALASVSMPNATSISDYAFYRCSALTSVDMPNVTSIGANAFYQCSALASVSMPSVTSIGFRAFYFCIALTSVDIANVTSIDRSTFEYCSELASVDMPKVESIGNYAFSGCYALASVSMPSVTSIGTRAFYRCSALTSVDIPKVESISDYAFNTCSALTSVDMPKVTSIGELAFSYCSTLTSLTIPSTCTSIGSSALNCGTSTNKCTFTFEGTTPPSIQTDTFSTNNINKIIVPKGCGDTYKTATNWTNFADYIEEATE